jgi:hypothetical protein
LISEIKNFARLGNGVIKMAHPGPVPGKYPSWRADRPVVGMSRSDLREPPASGIEERRFRLSASNPRYRKSDTVVAGDGWEPASRDGYKGGYELINTKKTRDFNWIGRTLPPPISFFSERCGKSRRSGGPGGTASAKSSKSGDGVLVARHAV